MLNKGDSRKFVEYSIELSIDHFFHSMNCFGLIYTSDDCDSGGNYGGLGGNCPPPIQQDSESVPRQSRGSLRKICLRSSYYYSSKYSSLSLAYKGSKRSSLRKLIMLAHAQRISYWVARCILGKSRGRVLEN